jgi:hypothetical protein
MCRQHNTIAAPTMSKLSLFLIYCLVLASVASSFTIAPTASRFGSVSRAGVRLQMSEEEETENDTATAKPKKEVVCPDCDLCDGSGRILGGIGVILPWWPIKAYRPCPNFINAGGQYQKAGQGLDEIAFGRDSTFERD